MRRPAAGAAAGAAGATPRTAAAAGRAGEGLPMILRSSCRRNSSLLDEKTGSSSRRAPHSPSARRPLLGNVVAYDVSRPSPSFFVDCARCRPHHGSCRRKSFIVLGCLASANPAAELVEEESAGDEVVVGSSLRMKVVVAVPPLLAHHRVVLLLSL